MDPVNVPAKFEVCSFTRPEITAIEIFGGGCKLQSWETGGHRGQKWYRIFRTSDLNFSNFGALPNFLHYITVRKRVGNFIYALHGNVSSIFTCLRYIASFVLQHTTFSHPTSSLPKISP